MNYQQALEHCRHWCIHFFQTLFDFSFKKTITTRMLPLLYGIGIFSLAVVCLYITFVTFLQSWIQCVMFVTMLMPLIMICGTALLRICLEFFAAVFSMLSALRATLTTLSKLEHTFTEVHRDITAIRRRFTEMTLTLESMDSRLTRMEAVLVEIDQIATRIPFLKTKKTAKKEDASKESQLIQTSIKNHEIELMQKKEKAY